MCSLISVVIPCFRSQSYLKQTVLEIRKAFETNKNYTCQIILIDDGSPDGTWEVIRCLCRSFSEIIGIRLSSNFGQARARMAALPHIKGDYAVFMDDDGQHPPMAIFSLVQKLSEGYDLVYARFPKLKESLFRKAASSLSDRTLTAVTKKPKDLRITSFFALSSFALSSLGDYQSPYIFLGGYLFEITKRITSVEIEQRPRFEGKSSYTFQKLYAMWLDNMLAFPHTPARLCRKTGFLTFLTGLIFLIAAFFLSFETLAIISALALGFGLLFVFLGILGEVILRTFCIIQGVPTYTVQEIITHDNP